MYAVVLIPQTKILESNPNPNPNHTTKGMNTFVIPPTDGQVTLRATFGSNLILDEGCKHLGDSISPPTDRKTCDFIPMLEHVRNMQQQLAAIHEDAASTERYSPCITLAQFCCLFNPNSSPVGTYLLFLKAENEVFMAMILFINKDEGFVVRIRNRSDGCRWIKEYLAKNL